jgi:hypothetical protein
LRYRYQERIEESESRQVAMQAEVHAADGQTVDVAIDLRMSRSFVSESRIDIAEGAAKIDPLIINFGGTAAELKSQRFAFDLDADGFKDQIALLGDNSAFLALDKNNDGKINNGSELFGPQSGNGFAELAQHDGDANRWIDESDSIYSRLRIWQPQADGSQTLLGLGQAGVGAIYLGYVTSLFIITDSANQSLGEVRSTGLHLNEDGRAASIQQVDLTA